MELIVLAAFLLNSYVVISWLLLALFSGYLSKSTKAGFLGGFILSLIFSPLVILFILLFREKSSAH